MNVRIANKLYELRKKSGLSQEELADKLGVSRQSVSKWERAEASPDTDNLILLSKIFGVSLDDIITEEDVEEAEKRDDEETLKEGIKIVVNEVKKKRTRADRIYEGLSSLLYLLAVIAFLLIGFLTGVWHPTWVVFLLAIVVDSVFRAIRKKNIQKFNYPIFVTAAYLFFSAMFEIWHPLWVLFLTIPIFYTVVGFFKKGEEDDEDDDDDDEDEDED